jgi:putative flippase GtrA
MVESAQTAEPTATAGRIVHPLARLVKFGLVGGTGVVVNLGLLGLLVEAVGWHYLVASLVAIEASTVSNYLLNRAWTWRDRDRSWWSLLSYHGVTFVGIVTQWVVLLVGSGVFGLHYLVAAALGIGAATAWNFVANHMVTFTEYTPERRRRHARVAMYAASLLVQLALAALLMHDWDTFVFQKSVEEFLQTGTTPYETGPAKPSYAYVGYGLPLQPLWYAYPPLPLLVMSLSYGPVALGLGGTPWLGRLLIHLPFVAANLVLAFVGHRVVSTAPEAGLGRIRNAARLETFLLFNPLMILVATIWGQFEALLLVFMLLSLLAMRSARWTRGGVFFGLATLVKIFPLYLAPLFVVWIVRRAGPAAAARYFLAGAAVFVAVSLPFFLAHPGGFLEQVFFMHAGRPPARFAPAAFLYETFRWFDYRVPGYMPTDEVLIEGLSLLSFTMTGLVLFSLAAASAVNPADERNLLFWSGLTIAGGLLVTKIVSEQYSVMPLVLLAAYYFHSRDAASPLRLRNVRGVMVTVTLFMSLAAVLDNAHFAIFLPEEVSLAVWGASPPDVIAGLAATYGVTVAQFKALIGVVVGVGLVVPLANAVRLVGPGIVAGCDAAVKAAARAFGRLLHPSLGARAALFAAVFLLLVPSVAMGVLGPKRDAAEAASGVVEEPLSLAHYRTDWYNPTHRRSVPAGTWDSVLLAPADGYYTATSHKVMTDLRRLDDAGFDGVVITFDPAYETQAATVRAVAEDLRYPFGLEVDLRHLAAADGRVGLTRETADRARELLDGPGFAFWRPGYHLRTASDGGNVVFLAGVWRVQPTFSDAERRFVADHAEELLGRQEAARLELASGTPLWRQAPLSDADLAAAEPVWQDAYAAARDAWWTESLSFGANGTRVALVVDAELVVPPAASAVEVIASYEPFDGAAVGEAESLPSFASVLAQAGRPETHDAAWAEAIRGAPEGLLVPWNDHDLGLAIEPTVLDADDAALERAALWCSAYDGLGASAADVVPAFAPYG